MGVRFTDEQRACVERLEGPLDISAGAGSGKTFTLTQRIAAALADPSSGVDDIDQICAITFTRKAAAELKGRVRSTLRAQGRLDQAMKVDGAWISTIHGACSRILRAEALEMGIDPGFSVLEGKERDDLFAQALSEVLGAPSDIVDGSVRGALLREFPVRSFKNEASVASMVSALAEAASGMPEGFGGFLRGPKPPAPSSIARELLQAYRDVEPFYRDCKPSKTRDGALADLEKASEALEAFVGSGSQDASQLVKLVGSCPVLRKIKSSDDARNEAFDTYQQRHSRAAQNAALLAGGSLLDELFGMARRVDAAFSRLKRDHAALDNNDLVRLALRALEDPRIGARYADRFRLVMVDEFQDTDALQIAIVGHLAGPGLCYLCTVGDAQQSIYRFRGADVNGYRAFRAHLGSPEIAEQGGKPALLQLTRNFRSHGDVLAFVKKVCAQPCVFGDGFLDLKAFYDGSGYRSQEPRVQLSTVLLPAGKRKAGDSARARAACADQVAAWFSRMRKAGHDPSDMVLLLGGMTHAQDYADALRRAGFECIVAGGSTFYAFPEVSVVRALAQALANPEDTAALFEVLTSEMFRLSADDLLAMATGWDETWEIPKNRKLDRGLDALRREEGLSPALRQAVEVLGKAFDTVRFHGLSRAVAGALRDSGWIARLQLRGAEGTAAIANILKAVRLIAQMEDGGAVGPVSAAVRFAALSRKGKDKPGVLNAGGGQAVRIMTIHASKGLEFPLVAVAELPSGAARSSALAMESRAGRTCVGLMPGALTMPAGSTLAKAVAKVPVRGGEDGPLTWEDALAASDAAGFYGALRDISSFEENAEAQRLFYVAATRAKEAVAVFLTIRQKKDDVACPGVADDIRSAFFGLGPFPEDACTLDYGGSQPAVYRSTLVDGSAGDPGAADAKDVAFGGAAADGLAIPVQTMGAFADGEGKDALDRAASADARAGGKAALECMRAPEVAPFAFSPCETPARPETGLFSYSSLSAALGESGHADGEAADAAPDAFLGGEAFDEPFPFDGAASVEAAREVSIDDAASGEAAVPVPVVASDSAAVPVDASSGEPSAFSSKDQDAATDFGSALHRLAQLAALRGDDAARAQLWRTQRTYGVRDGARLSAALERWLACQAHARALSFSHREPEYPFQLPVADGVLEGEIDLLCFDEPCSGRAFIVDYKTGGFDAETPEALADKHRLQGRCYALAVLSEGFEAVDLAFVRVERDDPAGADALQQVSYSYTADDLPELACAVAECRANSIHPTQSAGA